MRTQDDGAAHDGPDRRLRGPGRAIELGVLAAASAAVISLQLVFIRSFAITSYHHFVYLVVSTALLGFGASGTLLALLGALADERFEQLSLWALAGFAVATAWALPGSSIVPVDLSYLLYDAREAGRLWAATLILAVPFFLGGLFIGAVLRRERARPGPTYAANLLGSGAGGFGVLPIFFVRPPHTVAILIAGLVALAAVVWGVRARRSGSLSGWPAWAAPAVALVGVAAAAAVPWTPAVDEYKAGAFVRRLEEQGDARFVAAARSPVATWELYDAPSMHYTLFASPGAPEPPEQLQLLRDGFLAGALFRGEDLHRAQILDWLPQSLPYAVLEEPEVLILGETSGVNALLALNRGARSVTVVVPDPALARLVGAGEVAAGGVFDDPRVTVRSLDPRNALAQLDRRFDLIHLADTEGMPAASAGLVSLEEDYLLTTDAISLALERLRPGGLITATRGLQSPPRDTLRLVSLYAAAVRAGGGDPSERIALARNYLAATTMLARDPLRDGDINRLVSRAGELVMDVDYVPGIRPEDLTERNRVAGPSGFPGSYLHHGTMALVGDDPRAFIDRWVYRIDAPHDTRPYFHNFFRFSSLDTYVESYGHLWFSRLELGPVIVAVTLVQALLAGAVLILLPIVIARTRAHTRPPLTGWTVAHFGAIGVGFMALEMLFIQKTTLVLGDPVYSTAAVVTAILVWAGVGSAVQGRCLAAPERTVAYAGGAVVALALATLFAFDALSAPLAATGTAVRFLASVLLLAPVSFAMGWLFPAGVARLHLRRGEVGLGLAVNGVASVVAAPLAVLLSATFGFAATIGLAVGCYAVAALVAAVGGGRISEDDHAAAVCRAPNPEGRAGMSASTRR